MSVIQLPKTRFTTGEFETDNALSKVIGVDNLGYIKSKDVSSFTVDTVYTADGTLSGDRIINANSNSFGIANATDIELDCNELYLTNAPPTQSSNTDYLTRNSITGEVQLTTPKGSSYDAIVDASGNGDYINLQDAIAAGHSNIFMKDGTYPVNSTITVTDRSISITGESITNAVFQSRLVFGATAFSGNGTIAFTNASTTVTGTGTNFLSIPANYVLSYRGVVLQIDTIVSDTELTLSETYNGESASSIEWYAILPISLKLENFRFDNVSGTAIRIDSAISVNMNYIRCSNVTNDGFNITKSVNTRLTHCFASNCDRGFQISDELGKTSLHSCIASNCVNNGFRCADFTLSNANLGCSYNFIDCTSISSGLFGFEINNAANSVNLQDCVSIYSDISGFSIVNGFTTAMSGCSAIQNGDYGITITGGVNTDHVDILNCSLLGNNNHGIRSDSANVVIRGCNFRDNNGTSISSIAGGITIQDCRTEEANLVNAASANLCSITGNTNSATTNSGILLIDSASYATISNNHCSRIVVNNCIRSSIVGNAVRAFNSAAAMIQLTGSSSNNVVSSNCMYVTSGGRGIWLVTGSNNNVVIGNLQTGVGPVVDDDGTGNEVINNYLK